MHEIFLVQLASVGTHCFSFWEDKRLDAITNVLKNQIVHILEQRYLKQTSKA